MSNSEERVPGPNTLALPDLHLFQKEVMESLKCVFEKESERAAIVCLPTGSGKTRVAVQFAIENVLCPESQNRSVLWIAQSDELCEQAVETFDYVWRYKGAENTELRLIRYWGGQDEPVESSLDMPVVIVTTNLTLNNRKERVNWFSSPGIVVVDECHHQGDTYRGIDRWISSSEGSKNKEPMRIGLSATPFRTEGEDKSLRLRKKYCNNIFPENQKELYRRLTGEGILATPKNSPIIINNLMLRNNLVEPGNSSLQEIKNKIEEFKFLLEIRKKMLDSLKMKDRIFYTNLASLVEDMKKRCPRTLHMSAISTDSGAIDFKYVQKFEKDINSCLSDEEERNEKIVEYIVSNESESILFFGNSVAHSKDISDKLKNRGVSSCHVDGRTGNNKRKEYVDDFKNGMIRVICNYDVFSTGFDAPKVNAIIIARKVHSPVNFMQIVGRGLRGEKNGGTKECKIVTLLDDLGFEDFENHPVIRYLHESYYNFERYIDTYLDFEK